MPSIVSSRHLLKSLSRSAAVLLTVSAFVVLPAAPSSAALVTNPASLVDPFIGTGGEGFTSPAPTMPFGMLQWGPDTSPRVPGGGYSHDSTTLSGFSLDRLSGAGCFAFTDLPFLPIAGAVPADKNAATVGFSHSTETASVGSYAVTTAQNVRVELTSATRSALGQFTFPASQAATLLLKANGGAAVSKATVTAVGTTQVTGSISGGAFCARPDQNATLHFSVAFSQAFTSATKWAPAPFVTGDGGIALSFPAGSTVRARVGISWVSVANATGNRDTVSGFDLAATRTAAVAAWNALLGRVRIGGGTTAQQKRFYTALYHSLLHPNVFSDANRQYRGFDGVVRTVPAGQGEQYANLSGWDIYRSQVQLVTLLAPDRMSDVVRSMLNDYADVGRLPKWPLANSESYMMVGDPAIPTIAAAYAFGARNFDTAAALAAMVKQSTVPGNVRPGNVYLDTTGYLPADGGYGCCYHYGTTSTSLEYNIADFALAGYAKSIGDPTTHARFAERAQQWQYLLSPFNGFIQPRKADGGWQTPFDPTDNSLGDWAEANSWKYTPMVPFNPRGLAAAVGGDAAMIRYLDTHLTQLNDGIGPHFAIGNEPGFSTPWMYNYLGAPAKTQAVVRRIQNELFLDGPAGLPGNDDLGATSSWYVWSALGFYPAVPGTADLTVGTPLFPQAVIQLPGTATLTVNAPAAGPTAAYVQSMQINGAAYDKAVLPPTLITSGGVVDVTVGTTAGTWATAPESRAPSYATNAVAVADNVGTAADLAPGEANFDGWASGYSVQALFNTGIVEGSPVTAAGVRYVWPNVHSGQPNNVVAAGQRLVVSSPPGATTLGVLGSAEGDPDGVAGTATIGYSDGTSQTAPLGFSDWTLGGGTRTLRPGTTIVSAMPYRNQGLQGGQEQVRTYLFAANLPVDPAKTVTSLTLPPAAANGRLHVFTVGFGGHRDSVGVSDDAYTGGGNLDTIGNSYSKQALTAAGLAPGGTMTVDGLRYTWPAVPAGGRDNYRAAGQQLDVTATAGATSLGLLGSSTGLPGGSTGTATLTYTDGTQQQVSVGFSDWTLGGATAAVGHGNKVAAQMSYRNSAQHGRATTPTYVFALKIPLAAGKALRTVTLPSTTGGTLHVFAIATG
jgi:predicted alpha-1,2-mannosidase